MDYHVRLLLTHINGNKINTSSGKEESPITEK